MFQIEDGQVVKTDSINILSVVTSSGIKEEISLLELSLENTNKKIK